MASYICWLPCQKTVYKALSLLKLPYICGQNIIFLEDRVMVTTLISIDRSPTVNYVVWNHRTLSLKAYPIFKRGNGSGAPSKLMAYLWLFGPCIRNAQCPFFIKIVKQVAIPNTEQSKEFIPSIVYFLNRK